MSQFDQSGMRYKLEADGLAEFVAGLKSVREELLQTKAAVNQLKEVNQSQASGVGALTERLKQLRIEKRLGVLADQEDLAQSKEAVVVLNRRARAIADYNAQFDKKFRADTKAGIAAERNFVAETRLASAEQQLSKAHEAVTRVLDRRAQIEARRIALSERGVSVTDKEAQSLGILTKAEQQLANARNRLETAQTAATDPEIGSLNAKTQALQRLAAARRNLEGQQQLTTDPVLAALNKEADALARVTQAQKQLDAIEQRATDPRLKGLIEQADALDRVARAEAGLREAQAFATDPKLRSLKEQTDATNQLLAAEAALRKAQEEANNPRLKTIQAETDALQRQAAVEQDLAKQQSLAKDTKLKNTLAETEALKRQNAAEQESQTKAILASRGLNARGEQVARPEALSLKQKILDMLGLGRATEDTDSKLNRISFTFRRLVGIFALFTVVRQVIQGFRDLLREGIAFNAQVEQITVGIGGLIAATGDIRNAQGQSVKGAEAFAIAQGEAARQTKLLQRDALLTATTFTDLAEAFQVAVGPGLRSGLGLDQIRTFTREISIAANGLGLAQNQLAEEVRSILSGNITRNTRIAQVLTISNADIQRAKESGTLFDFLQSKLSVFLETADAGANTLTGLFTRFKGAIQVILGEGLSPFTNDLRAALKNVISLLVQIDSTTGKVTVNPQIVATVQNAAGFLRVAGQEAKNFIEQLGTAKIQRVAKSISDLLSVIILTVSRLVTGALSGIDAVLSALRVAQQIILNTFGFDIFDNKVLAKSAEIIGGILASLVTIALLSKGIALAWAGFAITLTPIAAIFKGVLGTCIEIGALGTGSLAKTFTNLQTLFKSLWATSLDLVKGIKGMAAAMLPFLATTIAAAVALSAVLFTVKLIKEGGLPGTSKAVGATQGVVATVKNKTEQLKFSAAAGIADFLGFDKEAEAARKFTKVLQKQLEEDVSNIKKGTQAMAQDEKSLGDLLKGAFTDAIDPISKGIDQVFDKFNKKSDEAAKSNPFDGFVLGVSEAIATLREKFKEFEDEARNARDEALASAQAIGLSGAPAQIIQTTAAGALRAAREAKDVERERLDLVKQRAAIETKLTALGAVPGANSFETTLNAFRAGAADLNPTALQEIVKLSARHFALTDQINDNLRFQKEVEEKIAVITASHVAAAAQIDAFETSQANRTLSVTAAHTEALRIAEANGHATEAAAIASQTELEVARISVQISQRELDLAILRLQAERDIAAAKAAAISAVPPEDRTREDSKALTAFTAQVNAQNSELDALREKGHLQGQIDRSHLAALERQAALDREARDNPIGAGVAEGLRQSAKEAGNLFQAMVTATRGLVSGIGSLVGQQVAAAFDPNSNFNLREATGQLLAQIGEQMIATLVEGIISQLLVAALGLEVAGTGAAIPLQLAADTWALVTPPLLEAANTLLAAAIILSAAGFGAATGGNIGELAANHARGFAGGGIPNVPTRAPRPSGLDPTDKVLFWGAPEEWVIKRPSVLKAGHDAMARLNAGMFNPYVLREALGLGPRRSQPGAAARAGFASGGQIPAAPGSGRSTQQRGSTGSSGSQATGVSVAIMAPSEQQFERQLRGGRTPLLQWLNNEGFRPARGA